MSNLPSTLDLRSLLLAASASLALAAFVPSPVLAAPPDSEGHELTTDSPELAADRARALQRVEQDRDAPVQEREAQQRREDASALAEQAATAQATTRTVNPLAAESPASSGSTASSPNYAPPPGASGSTATDPGPAAAEPPAAAAADPAANAETERSGSSTARSATNWDEDGKDMAGSGSSTVPGPAASDDAASAGAPLSRTPAPGTTPGENAADPVTAPSVAGEGGASVIPESERVDQ